MAEILDVLDRLQAELSNKNGYQMTSIVPTKGNIMINCPYHGGGRERNPSFGILTEPKRTAKGIVPAGTGNCFACGKSVSISRLVRDTLNGESEVIGEEWLEANFGISSFDNIDYIPKLLLPKDEMSLNYKQYIQYHPYMAQRGLNEKTCALFGLGYDAYTNSLVIPIKDQNGQCGMLIRRSINSKRFHNTSGSSKDRLLFGIDVLTYNLSKLQNAKMVWMVESAIDAMLLWQNGHIALATLQAQPTDEQLEMIRKIPFENIVIATDNDKAGNEAVDFYVKNLWRDKNLFRLKFPREDLKDIGDFTPQELKELKIYKKTEKPTQARSGLGILPLENGLKNIPRL